MSSVQPLDDNYINRDHIAGSCFHCCLPVPTNSHFEQIIDGDSRSFCCPACQMVCSAIYDAGLEGFYQRTPADGKLAPPPETPKNLALYDLDEVQEEFVPSLAREREIHLLVEGIHCAACVWLIERSLGKMQGVLDARVNLSGKRLLLRWDNQLTKLSHILSQLSNIGYAAIPYDPEVAEGKLKKQNRALLFRMAFAGFAMMNLLWISIALYSGAADSEYRSLFHWVGFMLATPTLLYSGYPFLHGAWTGLRRLHLTMDLPIAIGAMVTYLYSLNITLTQSTTGEVYYDTVVNFLFIILVGRYLEAMSKRQAIASTQRLLDLQPRGAIVLRDNKEILLPVRAVKNNDIVLVKPGEHVPVDGIILDGHSTIDESMLSGESTPVSKNHNDKVFAGTINNDSPLTVQVKGILRNTSLGRIIHLVEDAQASKAPVQCVADRVVPWFVAITLLLATFTFMFWINTDFEIALMAATAVLIITCPCAFGLATPMAIASASGLGARHGILVKSGGVLETLSQIDHFVFDKTGTLTEGRMQVNNIITANGIDEDELISFAAAIEKYSEHSIARAIIEKATSRELDLPAAKNVSNKPGHGITGKVNDTHIVIGTSLWLKQNNIMPNQNFEEQSLLWEHEGSTCVHIAIEGREVGLIAIADRLRPGAKALIDALKSSGIRTTLLSGDRKPVVKAIAEQLGGMETIAEVLPEDKERIIRQLQKNNEKVAMVGDGVNDAPALVRADVGIALGSGTDISCDSADIILMSNELHNVLLATKLSQRTLKTIRQNIGISITYNIIMVPLAVAALITPLVAAISMPISSLLVIANAGRIRTLFKKETPYNNHRDNKWK